jgi:hypothetical protein
MRHSPPLTPLEPESAYTHAPHLQAPSRTLTRLHPCHSPAAAAAACAVFSLFLLPIPLFFGLEHPHLFPYFYAIYKEKVYCCHIVTGFH